MIASWWVFLYLTATFAAANILSVPLKKHIRSAVVKPSPLANDEWARKILERSRQDADTIEVTIPPGVMEERFTGTQDVDAEVILHNNKDVFYYGPVFIGTPRQEFQVLYDSGSNDLWVPSSQCSSFNIPCWKSKKYENRVSSTYSKDGDIFDITYVTGYCLGYTSRDTVAIGKAKIKNQLFGEVVEQPNPIFMHTGFDGILGLGTPEAIPNEGGPTVLQSMVDQTLISSRVFCFYLNRNKSEGTHAEVTFGGCLDRHHSEEFSYAPVTHKKMWAVDVTEIQCTYGQSTLGVTHKMQSLIDSGTTMIILPLGVYSVITTWMLKLGVLNDGLVDCASIPQLPVINFKIAGKNYPLYGEDYAIKIQDASGEAICFIGFNYWENSLAIFGDVFMRRYYTMFDGDRMRIGFAPAF